MPPTPRSGKPQSEGQPGGHDRVSALAQEALEAFRHDQAAAYKELVEVFDGRGADIALLGEGRFHIAVRKGEVRIEPNVAKTDPRTGRGAAAPETVHAILSGQSTPLEEFFRGNLIAQAASDDLHRVYDYFVQFAEGALRSERMRKVAEKFRQEFPPPKNYNVE